jgi:hypothetical protein
MPRGVHPPVAAGAHHMARDRFEDRFADADEPQQ